MTETLLNQGGDDPLQDVKALVANWMKCLSDMQQALEENEQLRQRVAALESANAQKDVEIKNLSTELQEKERKLTELGKLSASMAKKSPQDDVAKAIRIYMNTSKRKTLSKREAAKTVLLELITAAKLEMPEDTMELLCDRGQSLVTFETCPFFVCFTFFPISFVRFVLFCLCAAQGAAKLLTLVH